jgi:hypothetical protein
MKRFQMVKMSASTLKYILQAQDDAALARAGDSAGNDVPKTYILAKWGRLSVDNCLEFLKITSIQAKFFVYSEAMNEGKLSFTLSHNFGNKGTLFLQHYVHAMFAPLGKGLRFTPDENAVTFELT